MFVKISVPFEAYCMISDEVLEEEKRRGELGQDPIRGSSPVWIVPKQHYMFEAEEISYRRVDVDNVQKFKEYIAQFNEGRVIGEVPPSPAELPEGDPLFTFIDLCLVSRDGGRYIFVLAGTTIYFMNDEGKTIDSVRV